MSLNVPSGPVQAEGYGEDPLAHYTNLFIRFLQFVFASFDAGNYRWSNDDKSEIFITDTSPLEASVVEQRPAIIVTRGAADYGNLSLDQFAGPVFTKEGNLLLNFDPSTSKRRHTDLNSAVMTFNCLSSQGREAQRLGAICAMATRRLKRTIMKAGVHRVAEQLGVSAESPPGSLVQGDPKEILAVTVSVPFFWQDFWSVEPVDKVLLNELQMVLSSQVEAPADGAVPLKGASGTNGRPLLYDQVLTLSSSTRVFKQAGPKSPK